MILRPGQVLAGLMKGSGARCTTVWRLFSPSSSWGKSKSWAAETLGNVSEAETKKEWRAQRTTVSKVFSSWGNSSAVAASSICGRVSEYQKDQSRWCVLVALSRGSSSVFSWAYWARPPWNPPREVPVSCPSSPASLLLRGRAVRVYCCACAWLVEHLEGPERWGRHVVNASAW